MGTQRVQRGATNLWVVLVIYLTGLLIGGLYVGMVSPVRTVVQAHFGIDGSVGIWMINIYTLFYAALIPVIGKVADRIGRKRVFTVCTGSFAVG
jgi:MFS family permease